MSSARLGIAFGAREVRAVLVRKQAVQWSGAAPLHGIDSIGAAVAALAAQLPASAKGQRAVVVAGSAWVRVKPIDGLPAMKSARLATQLLRENTQAFFLSRGGPLVVADVHFPAADAPWGAAFDRDAVIEMTRALRAARIQVKEIVPASMALSAVFPGKEVTWKDHGHYYMVGAQAESALRDDARSHLDAYAAAVAPRQIPLAWRPEPDRARSRWLAVVRTASLGTALTAAAGFATVGPGLRAKAFSSTASAELARREPARQELVRGEADLRRVTQLLDRVESFKANRGQVSRLLGDLSQSIPESTAILTFHVDTAEGGFTAIAPHIADVLPELGAVTDAVAPRIIGSVTRETMNGLHLERATFRFRRPRATPAKRGAK